MSRLIGLRTCFGLCTRRIFAGLLISSLFTISVSVLALAPTQNSRFKSYLGEQGLAIGSVESIIQDHQGFIWLGGTDGLARYDGYDFQTYRYNDKDGTSLSNNTVWAIYEDRKGRLWVGTEAGLNLFNRHTQTFTRYMYSESNTNSVPSNLIKTIAEDDSGNLWVGTYGGMAHFDPSKNIFTRYYHQDDNTNSLTSNLIRHIFIDKNNILWISTEGGGLDQFDPEQNIFTHYQNNVSNPKSLPHNIVNHVYEDLDGRLWIGTDNGISQFNRKEGNFINYLRNDAESAFSNNHVRTIHQDRYGNLWVASDFGLFILEKDANEFNLIQRNPLDPYTLTSNAIRDICEDSSGDIWLGTFPEGVSYLDRNNMAFKTFTHSPVEKNTLTHSSVLSLQQDHEGNLLVGTDGGGLNIVDKDSGQVTAFEHDARDPNTLSGNAILSIAAQKDGIIWAGTWGAGLNRLDPETAKTQRYFLDYQWETTISNNNIWSLYIDSRERLWVGTLGGGLNLYQKKTTDFKRYLHNPNIAGSIASPLIWDVFEDSRGRLWFATGSGLNMLDEQSDTFMRYAYPEAHTNSLTLNSMLTIHEKEDGLLWLGTRGAGLLRFNPEDGTFKNYSSNTHELINDMVVSIQSDSQGHLWLGTNYGLAKFSPKDEEFFNFDQTNGLQGNQFNLDSSIKFTSGELAFGGTKGYTRFLPSEVMHNTTPPQIVFTEFQIFNKPVPIQKQGSALNKSINYAEKITLKHGQSVFSISYSALNFRHSERNQYAYKLEGFDKEWNNVGEQRTATYTNLDPGSYTFTVIASNNDGIWNKEGKSIAIKILPPPWQTWWAYSLYFVAALFAIAYFFNAQRRKIEYEIELNRQLEKQVAERTKELEEKNSELKTAYTKLEDISQSDPLTGLYNRRYLYRFLPHDSAKVIRAYEQNNHAQAEGEAAPSVVTKDSDLIFFLVDADHFKSVNDEYGHINGDRVLIQFSDILQQVCRESDCIVRWGGEEFLIVSRFTNREQAPTIAERIRRSVENHIFSLDNNQTIQRTCSIGFACFPFNRSKPDELTPEQTIDIADRCLYMVKNNQRNGWMGFYLNDDSQSGIIDVLEAPESFIKDGTLSMQTSITTELKWE